MANLNNLYIKTFQEYCDEKIFIFPIATNIKMEKITKGDTLKMSIIKRVYPTKQKYVKQIWENEDILSLCKKIILFGSSISMKCHKDSDMDFYIELKEDNLKNRNTVSEILGELLNWNFDIIWGKNDEALYKNDGIYKSIKKEVSIYGKINI